MVDDAVLPAAAHLTGPEARHVLAATVTAAGGELHEARATQVQYRPGSEIVVRYDATIAWAGGPPTRETLLAATTARGMLPGTVPMVAETDDGELEVSVWRWPFDPVLPGLADAVTPARAAALLGDLVPDVPALEVVAYRPTERAVVRVRSAAGTELYVKLVRPDRAGELVDRHERLRAAGIPAPQVVAADPAAGWFAMEALPGETVRERLKQARPPWPDAAAYLRLVTMLRPVELPGAQPVPGRVADALGHARMLRIVLPEEADRIDRICAALAPAVERAEGRRGPTVHGDLYEAQLTVDVDGVVIGLLDIDEAGPGDPYDDLATVLGHLRFRADRALDRPDLTRYLHDLWRGFAAAPEVDPVELDVAAAAVMVGLATGPFRTQHADWRSDVAEQLRAAEAVLAAAGRGAGG